MDLYEFEAPRRTSNVGVTRAANPAPPIVGEAIEPVIGIVNHQLETTVEAPVRRPTYLERLRGEQPQHINVDLLPDPEFEDGVPIITLPQTALERGRKYCEFSLVGRLDFKKITLDRARALTTQLMAPTGDWKIVPLGRGFFMLRLDNKDDFVRIWAQTYKFDNQTLRFIQWTPEFDPDTQKPATTLLWVQLPKLKQQYWDYELLMSIGKGLGTPIGVDQRTLSREKGYFANVLIDIDLSKPVPSKINVREENGGTFAQEVEIPKMPVICTHCKGVGHAMFQCRGLIRVMQEQPREDANKQGNNQNQWQRVGRRQGRNRQQYQQVNGAAQQNQNQNNRPTVILEHGERNGRQNTGPNGGRQQQPVQPTVVGQAAAANGDIQNNQTNQQDMENDNQIVGNIEEVGNCNNQEHIVESMNPLVGGQTNQQTPVQVGNAFEGLTEDENEKENNDEMEAEDLAADNEMALVRGRRNARESDQRNNDESEQNGIKELDAYDVRSEGEKENDKEVDEEIDAVVTRGRKEAAEALRASNRSVSPTPVRRGRSRNSTENGEDTSSRQGPRGGQNRDEVAASSLGTRKSQRDTSAPQRLNL